MRDTFLKLVGGDEAASALVYDLIPPHVVQLGGKLDPDHATALRAWVCSVFCRSDIHDSETPNSVRQTLCYSLLDRLQTMIDEASEHNVTPDEDGD